MMVLKIWFISLDFKATWYQRRKRILKNCPNIPVLSGTGLKVMLMGACSIHGLWWFRVILVIRSGPSWRILCAMRSWLIPFLQIYIQTFPNSAIFKLFPQTTLSQALSYFNQLFPGNVESWLMHFYCSTCHLLTCGYSYGYWFLS